MSSHRITTCVYRSAMHPPPRDEFRHWQTRRILIADSLDASRSARLPFEPITRVRGKEIDQFGMVGGDNRLTSSLIGRVGKPHEPRLNFGKREIAFRVIKTKRIVIINCAGTQSIEGNKGSLAIGEFAETIFCDPFRSVVTRNSKFGQ